MAYIGTQPKDVRSFGKAQFDFTATASQTVFSGADDDGKTLGFTTGQIQVYVNGILMDASDYTTSNGNTVTLASAANANDIITVVALQTDIPNSDYVPATGGTFSGAVTHTGAFTSRGIDDNATSTAMTLDASGNLLVGKTSADVTTAGARIFPTGDAAFVTNGSAPIIANRLTSDGDIAVFRKDGTTVGSIGSSGGYTKIISGNGTFGSGLIFNNVAINPVNAAGSVADATVKLGDTTSRFTDLYLSGGVYLGGTGAANKLTDYEEGTWTPVPQTTSGGLAYNLSGTEGSYGRYVKVGNLVTCWFDIYFNITAIGSGSAMLGGFPFSVGMSTQNGGYTAANLRACTALNAASDVTAYYWGANLYFEQYNGYNITTAFYRTGSNIRVTGEVAFYIP